MASIDGGKVIVSDNPFVQHRYEEMRKAGESHMMAEMLAHQHGPGLETDNVFLEGHCNGNQFAGNNEHIGNFYRKKAHAAGVSTTGKVYYPSLAAFPGDPQAWVSGRGDVKKLVSDRNWSVEGMVRHESNRDNDNGYDFGKVDGVAEDIIDAEVEADIQENPGMIETPAQLQEHREKVRERLRPPEDK